MRIVTTSDQEIAKNLRRVWKERKDDLGLTQVKMAEKLGITQPAFSQFLNGTVSLNTDMVIAIASVLKVAPDDIDPRRGKQMSLATKKVQQVSVPVLFSMEGDPTGDNAVVVELVPDEKTVGSYAIHIDTNDYEFFNIYEGCYLIMHPSAKPRKGSLVVITTKKGRRYMGKFVKETDDSLTVIDPRGVEQTNTKELVFSTHKVGAIQY